jgi:hypothetical protein
VAKSCHAFAVGGVDDVAFGCRSSRSYLCVDPMRRASAIIATDSPSRDGIRLATRVLFNMLADRWLNGMPQLVAHDAHRPIGWAFPDKLIIQPGMTRLHAVLEYPENKEEQQTIRAAYQERAAERDDRVTDDSLDRLRTLLKPTLDGSEKVHGTQGACFVGDNLARRAAPQVFSTEDKAGLVALDALDAIAPGVFCVGELVLS